MKEGFCEPMKWIEARVTVASPDAETVLDLVAQCFLDLGLKGVVVEDPHPPDVEADWVAGLPAGPTGYAVIGYFRDDEMLPENCRQLEESVGKLLESFSETDAETNYRRIDEEDWSHSWKAYFKPVSISETIVIKPSWCEYTAQKGQKILELDPGMAFGTGTHPTTAMCVQMIEKLLPTGGSILDIGTGTGVLLIAAALLGAANGRGIDNDLMAVTIAKQNLALNGVDPVSFLVNQGDLVATLSEPSNTYNLIVANILANAIKALTPDTNGLMAPKGVFIASGLLVKDEEEIKACFQQYGLTTTARIQQEEWLCLAAQRVK